MIAILSDTDTALFYCTTTEWAFGPVIGNDDEDKSDENDPHARAKRFRLSTYH